MPSFPSAAGKPHASLQPGDSSLDTCSEAAQAGINILTAAHIDFFKPSFFKKTNIFYFQNLVIVQFGFGGKSTIQAGLERISSVDILLAVKHGDRKRTVSRIALKNLAIQNRFEAPPLRQILWP